MDIGNLKIQIKFNNFVALIKSAPNKFENISKNKKEEL